MKHKNHLLLFSFCLMIGVAYPSLCSASQTLEQTELFSKITRACKDVELQNWAHPTVKVLQDTDVRIDHAQLCNNDQYLIYTVRFKYDPETSTSSYFHPLYARMAEVNNYRSFSFVDETDQVIVNIMIDRKHRLHIEYEEYKTRSDIEIKP